MVSLETTALASSTAKLRRFCSSPFLQCTVLLCDPFKDRHGTIMSHRGNCGWWIFPSSSITTVSQTCLCHKCTHMDVRIATRPLQNSTGQGLGPAFSGNAILYILGSYPPPYPSPSCPGPPYPLSAGFVSAPVLVLVPHVLFFLTWWTVLSFRLGEIVFTIILIGYGKGVPLKPHP